MLTDVHTGSTYAYTYNGREQLAKRVVTNSGSADGTAYYVYDQWGNLLAELDGSGNTLESASDSPSSSRPEAH